ncbi:MAG: amidohydrolase family protein [Gammaproteobacteria bacterium]
MPSNGSRSSGISRRTFLAGALGAAVPPTAHPIIDIHQHTNYSGRSDHELVWHQQEMGIARTVLLPAGRLYGLAASAGRNETVVALARRFPDRYVFFANELPDIPGTRAELEKYLKLGAIGIGEQKFPVECDSPAIDLVAEIAREFNVPVLMHFQHEAYNTGFERFHRTLKKHPRVNFIGHAQTWWGNIDRNHVPTVMYPKTRVTPGGITDRLLSDYPNMYGDLSAGSGLNSMLRDEEHAQDFLRRHQEKLIFGSDCNDRDGHSECCSGWLCIKTIRRLAPDEKVARKILYENAVRVLKIRL